MQPTNELRARSPRSWKPVHPERSTSLRVKDLKAFQKGTGKLSARNQILFGKIYLALEQPAKAFTFFEKAIFTSTSTDDRAYAGMSLSSLKLGNLTDAQKYAEKALERNHDLVQAKLALGQVY